MSGQHARLAPSGAWQWMHCAGQLILAQNYPEDKDSPEAREGTAAHHVAAELLGGVVIAEGETVPPGITVTPEMVEGAAMYRDHVAAAVSGRLELVQIERPIRCTPVHPDCYGTPDAWSFYDGVLDLWDYKYGFRFVEVFENWQLLCYVAGILALLNVSEPIRIRMHIVQPRSFHRDGPIRTWEIDSVRFRGLLDRLAAAAAVAGLPGSRTTVGSWCRNCAAARGCDALSAAAYEAVAISGSTVPFDLDAQAVGRELRTLSVAAAALQARVEGLEQQAIAQIRRGEYVPFWQMGEKRTNLKWTKPDEEIIALGELLGVNLAKPPKACTPTQAMNELKVDAAVIMAYATRPRGELKLKPADITEAQKAFSK